MANDKRFVNAVVIEKSMCPGNSAIFYAILFLHGSRVYQFRFSDDPNLYRSVEAGEMHGIEILTDNVCRLI